MENLAHWVPWFTYWLPGGSQAIAKQMPGIPKNLNQPFYVDIIGITMMSTIWGYPKMVDSQFNEFSWKMMMITCPVKNRLFLGTLCPDKTYFLRVQPIANDLLFQQLNSYHVASVGNRIGKSVLITLSCPTKKHSNTEHPASWLLLPVARSSTIFPMPWTECLCMCENLKNLRR